MFVTADGERRATWPTPSPRAPARFVRCAKTSSRYSTPGGTVFRIVNVGAALGGLYLPSDSSGAVSDRGFPPAASTRCSSRRILRWDPFCSTPSSPFVCCTRSAVSLGDGAAGAGAAAGTEAGAGGRGIPGSNGGTELRFRCDSTMGSTMASDSATAANTTMDHLSQGLSCKKLRSFGAPPERRSMMGECFGQMPARGRALYAARVYYRHVARESCAAYACNTHPGARLLRMFHEGRWDHRPPPEAGGRGYFCTSGACAAGCRKRRRDGARGAPLGMYHSDSLTAPGSSSGSRVFQAEDTRHTGRNFPSTSRRTGVSVHTARHV